ncbi:uncharacterized protein FIBRA_01365 [Fibroporia radiculosa]|uniref:Aspartate aminotransferase n=1 Tax=Fibroporia radiculosa TaxID=599839 RepID=J4HT76_9APHY|nr:uncharacterized protein FIBRA_01365 [Fibroporia radiculosa]CCL99347.1 predicted protein [Fibroporia radiculosa]
MADRLKQLTNHLQDNNSNMSVTAETWESVPLAPPDAIYKLTYAYKDDTYPQKVNLGVGAYRDDNNKPWILPVVKKATERLLQDPNLDHEYLPITGLPEFTSAGARLVLGPDSPALLEGRVSSVQTISGTGANHLGALFLSRFYQWEEGVQKVAYVSDPTWVNHFQIFRGVGIELKTYPYYDPATIGLAFEKYLAFLKAAPRRSVFVMHACAHNPTGVDPTREQWTQIADVVLERAHYVFFDCAYQGFASGDLDNDAWAVREFVKRGAPLLICQSFAKNAGLYGERVGALHIIPPDGERAQSAGARSASGLFEEWKVDIKTMAERIIAMRKELHRLLTEELKTPGNWDHIVNQIGMFR